MADTEPEPETKAERLPEPDKEAHQAAVQKIQDEIATKQNRMVSPPSPLVRPSGLLPARGRGSAGWRAEQRGAREL
jgi:hypothetical protein